MPSFTEACNTFKQNIIYNGDIKTLDDVNALKTKIFDKKVTGIMIGRGLVRNPLLAESIKEHRETICFERMIGFLDDIVEEYMSLNFGERNTLFKLKEIWGMILGTNEGTAKVLKKIRKANTVKDYKMAVNELL